MKFSLNSKDNEGYSKVEVHHKENILKMAEHYHEILKLLGEDTQREGLIKTPVRISKAMQFPSRRVIIWIRRRFLNLPCSRKITGRW